MVNSTIKTEWDIPKIILCVVIILSLILLFYFLFMRPNPSLYIALGDSIASGFGLQEKNSDPADRYPNVLYEKIKNDKQVKDYINLAEDGLTTTKLLEKLHNLDSKDLRKFKKAKVVTLNIGGNNILVPFLDYYSDTKFGLGMENIKAGGSEIGEGAKEVIYEMSTTIRSVVSDSLKASFNARGVGSGLKRIGSGLVSLISGGIKAIGGSPEAVSAWQGELPQELEFKLDEGVVSFVNDFEEIIIWINKNAPNATLIVNTIFNPIPQKVMNIPIPMYEISTQLIEAMNEVIVSESKSKDYLVVEVYTAFQNRSDLIKANINPFSGKLSLDMVHPNEKGHKLIADMNYEVFKKNTKGE